MVPSIFIKEANPVKRRGICLAAAVLLCLQLVFLISGTVQAKTENMQKVHVPMIQMGELPETVVYDDRDYSQAEQAIYEGLLSVAETINLKQYKLTPEEVYSCYCNVVNSHVELFYLSDGYGYSYFQNVVLSIVPEYSMTQSEIEAAKLVVEEKTQEICSLVDPQWSQVEIMLFLHDYLCTNYEYDNTLSIFDLYHFYTQGAGVCQAYYSAYRYLLDQFGIVSDYARSDSMVHIWNVVELNGVWYHVDVTWDDPIYDRLGRAGHYYFLRSDSGISVDEAGATSHYDWSCGPLASASGEQAQTYDQWFWQTIDTAFVPLQGIWYYLDEAYGLRSVDLAAETPAPKDVLAMDSYWPVLDQAGYYWVGIFSGLSAVRNELIWNTPEYVVAYDLETETLRKVFRLEETEKDIYGSTVQDGTVVIAAAASPNESGEHQTVTMGTLYESQSQADTAVGWTVFLPDSTGEDQTEQVLEIDLQGDETDETIYLALVVCYENDRMTHCEIEELTVSQEPFSLHLAEYQEADTVKFFLLGAAHCPCTEAGYLK